MKYKYEISGTSADGQSWETKGEVLAADFIGVTDAAAFDSFTQLTEGKAVFGKPGVGCRGPYKITRYVLELVP